MKLILRILAFPFVLGIVLVTYNYHAIRNGLLFLRYGGEWITYAKDDRRTIYDYFHDQNMINNK